VIVFGANREYDFVGEGLLLGLASELLPEPGPNSLKIHQHGRQANIHLDNIAGEDDFAVEEGVHAQKYSESPM
jgi:hypothetical protein